MSEQKASNDALASIINMAESERQFKSEIADLERAVVSAAVKWREAEVSEMETNLCDEREERHHATYSALCGVRGTVLALIAAREKVENG